MADRYHSDDRLIYRTMVLAFVIWALHFIVAYGAALVFPGSAVAIAIALIAACLAVVAIGIRVFRLPRPRPTIAVGSLGLSLAAIVLGTLPAVVG